MSEPINATYEILSAIDRRLDELLRHETVLEYKAGRRYLRLRRLQEINAPKFIIEQCSQLLEEVDLEYKDYHRAMDDLTNSRDALGLATWEDFHHALFEAEDKL